jgi:formylglycine-generating enzyme required for sulfatase activity
VTNTAKPGAPLAGTSETRSKDGMVMVLVPAGEFLMGSTGADVDAVMAYCSECKRDFFADEQPQRTVFLDAFWIDRTEVTNAQYELCVRAGVCRVADMGDYDPQGRPNHPVVQVTWYDAQTYCRWAGGRLPTEAEWEKAARGVDGRLYPWGSAAPDCSKAQYEQCGGGTVAVGSRSAGQSPYGLQDAAGNAWEWVSDWYDAGYYTRSPGRNPLGPDSGEYRVLRGGSYSDGMRNMRPADRGNRTPAERLGRIGFRCAASP